VAGEAGGVDPCDGRKDGRLSPQGRLSAAKRAFDVDLASDCFAPKPVIFTAAVTTFGAPDRPTQNWVRSTVEHSLSYVRTELTSPIASRKPDNKSSRCSGFRRWLTSGITTGVMVRSRAMTSRASSSRPICA
jgi:hypothetical protein